MSGKNVTAWIIADGKAGHEKQSRGLIQALGELLPVEEWVLSSPFRSSFFHWLSGKFPKGEALPPPDLIVATGHATHLPALAARRAYGGKLVVLMKPSFPLGWFDLCLLPAHDGVAQRPNLIVTRGALNQMQRSQSPEADRGLFLIGGPSKQFSWADQTMSKQVLAVAEADSEVSWTLTTSRRTPLSFLPLLGQRAPANLEIVPLDDTGPEWVAKRLQEAGTAWISEDSVSMTYEALTAGCRVGLLESAMRGSAGRVSKGIEALRRDGWVTRFSDWQSNGELGSAPVGFNEARRCAEAVVERWFRKAN
jgi:mitochondrial fission protein ELM1